MTNIHTRAIFRSTSQALHFAFLIQAYEVAVESIMTKALRIIMQERGIWHTGAPSTVNFGGLNALEVRAQCAMIRAVVCDRLPSPESWVIQARYGINEITLADGDRKQVFSRTRYDAILKLSEWLQPTLQINPMVADVIVARVIDRRVAGDSFRALADKFGVSKSTIQRATTRARELIQGLENRAIERLTPDFVRDGLVEAEMIVCE